MSCAELPPLQLPTSAIELILAITPQLVIPTPSTCPPATAEQHLLVAQIVRALPHRTVPLAFKSCMFSTNNSAIDVDAAVDHDASAMIRGGGCLNLDRLLVHLTRSTTHATSVNTNWPLAWYLGQLAPLAALFPTRMGRKLVWVVCTRGYAHVLDWMLAQPLTRALVALETGTTLSAASLAGHHAILCMCVSHGLPVPFTGAIARAVGRGGFAHVHDWWDRTRSNLGLDLAAAGVLPTDNEVWLANQMWDAAFCAGHVDILTRVHERYGHVMNDPANEDYFWTPAYDWARASELRNVHVLDWALGKFVFPDWDIVESDALPMDCASELGFADVLEWWATRVYETGEYLPYSQLALEEATRRGRVDVLEWWSNSGLELAFTPRVVQVAMEHGHANVVQWWHACGVYRQVASGGIDESGKDRLIPRHPITLASFGRLEWLQHYCPPSEQTPAFIVRATRQVTIEFRRLDILNVYADMFQSRLAANDDLLVPLDEVCVIAIEAGHLDIVQWWFEHAKASLAEDHARRASLWHRCADMAMGGDHAHILEWILTNSNAKRLLVSREHQHKLMVARVCGTGKVKCLQLLYMLGLVSPAMLSRQQVSLADPAGKEWWNRAFPEHCNGVWERRQSE